MKQDKKFKKTNTVVEPRSTTSAMRNGKQGDQTKKKDSQNPNKEPSKEPIFSNLIVRKLGGLKTEDSFAFCRSMIHKIIAVGFFICCKQNVSFGRLNCQLGLETSCSRLNLLLYIGCVL